jgi:hypothetical protein
VGHRWAADVPTDTHDSTLPVTHIISVELHLSCTFCATWIVQFFLLPHARGAEFSPSEAQVSALVSLVEPTPAHPCKWENTTAPSSWSLQNLHTYEQYLLFATLTIIELWSMHMII